MTVAVGVGTVTAKGDMLVGAMAIGRMLAMTLDPAICDWEGGAWGLTAAGEVDIGLMLAVLGDSVTGALTEKRNSYHMTEFPINRPIS